MAHKNKTSMARYILSAITVVPSLFRFSIGFVHSFSSEFRIAGKSIVSLLIFLVVFGILLTTTWICLLSLLFVYLTSLAWTALHALLLLLLINIVLVGIILIAILRLKRNLTFPETRQLFQAVIHPDDY